MFLLAGLFLLLSSTLVASPRIGEAAPLFTLKDLQGKEYSLADLKGKFVVLEWVNFDCPFVGKHYGSGNMQKLQKEYTEKGVTWLSICSSAEGKQGYFELPELKERIAEEKSVPTAYLIDESGEVGKKYEAKTTPHMFVINPEGILLYAGGIDDKPSTDRDDIKTATNYVSLALDAAMAGQEVKVTASKPYGCSVKYK
jgi:peroxiredoxin